eukprot:5416437-Prymnesium_polylepis.1
MSASTFSSRGTCTPSHCCKRARAWMRRPRIRATGLVARLSAAAAGWQSPTATTAKAEQLAPA